jgi:hypothetical protein
MPPSDESRSFNLPGTDYVCPLLTSISLIGRSRFLNMRVSLRIRRYLRNFSSHMQSSVLTAFLQRDVDYEWNPF